MIDVMSECQNIVADGLGLPDLLATEGAIVVAAFEIAAAYVNGSYTEPPTVGYVQKDTPA
jgi:hypothetical protein